MTPDPLLNEAGQVLNRRCLPTRWARVYSLGMVDFTREEVEDIVDKLEKAGLGGGNLCHAGQRGKYVDWCIFTPEFFSV